MRSTARVRDRRSMTDGRQQRVQIGFRAQFAAELDQRSSVVIDACDRRTGRRDPESTCAPDQTAAP